MRSARLQTIFLYAFIAVNPALADSGRPSVLVNPHVRGNGTATTIQEGIGMVADGGKVLVLPATYEESLLITKSVTIEAIASDSGEVILASPAGSVYGIEVRGSVGVTLRGLHIQHSGLYGVGSGDPASITIEHCSVVGSLGNGGRGVVLQNDAIASGKRARLVVRDSFVDLQQSPTTTAQNFGINPIGDVDSIIERNVVRRTGGAGILIQTLFTGETNADVIANDLDELYPVGRAGSIIVGPPGGITPTQTAPITGTVNLISNIIHNSTASCRISAGINFETLGGRIEHNVIESAVPSCAASTARNLQAGIWIGARASLRRSFLPPATPVVRFNDVTGNAFAGLRVSPDQSVAVEATCNWWGDAAGPFAPANTVVGAAAFIPWATQPIAGSTLTSCQ